MGANTNELNKHLIQIAVTYKPGPVDTLHYAKAGFQGGDPNYTVKSDGSKLHIYLDRSKIQFPATIGFYIQNQDWCISGIGFSVCKSETHYPTPTKAVSPGTKMANGVFELDCGVEASDVGVLDSGGKNPHGYAFKLWIKNLTSHQELEFDPRVYNRAAVPPLDYKERLWETGDLQF